MTLDNEAKISARKTQNSPTTTAAQPYVENGPVSPTAMNGRA